MPVAALVGGLGYAAHRASSGGRGIGGVVSGARGVLAHVQGLVGRVSGRGVSEAQAGMLVLAAAYLLYRFVLSGDGSDADADAPHGYAAYSKGFRDGQSGAPFEPIVDAPAAAASSGGGWGIGRMFSWAMVASMVYQMGMAGGVWSVQNLMAGARQMSPMHMMILMNMLSGLF